MCFAAAMVVFPSVTESGSKSAIIIWSNSIVPILLPFFIFADFIKNTGNLERLPVRAYPFVIAFLSGYPMGAKIVGDLICDGTLSKEEGKHVLSYSLVTGPGFIIGTIGAFLGNSQAAMTVAIAHYMGALINGLLYKKNEIRKDRQIKIKPGASHKTYLENFTVAIIAGFKAMAVILAYLIIFMIGVDLLETAGILKIFHNEVWSSVVKGIMEMTVGVNTLGMCNVSMEIKTVLTSFIISFGGLSVIGQSVSMAAGSGLTVGNILRIKFTHGLLAGILAEILVHFI